MKFNELGKIISLIVGVATLAGTLLTIAYKMGCKDTEQSSIKSTVSVHASDIQNIKGSLTRIETNQNQIARDLDRIKDLFIEKVARLENEK